MKEYDHRETLLDELYEARARWERKDYLLTARVMGDVANGGSGIDEALDALTQYDIAIGDFERVFR
jgi:hypothetical protein